MSESDKKEDRLLGIYDDMDFEQYRRSPGINNSGLKLFHESPARYQDERKYPRPYTDSKKIGDAFHCAVFEPERFARSYIPAKYPEFKSEEAKAWRKAALESGFTVLRISNASEDPHRNPPEWDLVNYMADAVRQHPEASVLIEHGVRERSVFWVDRKFKTGKLCKARFDFDATEAHRMLLDLKSAEDCSYEGFRRAVNRFGYFRQDVWYMGAAQAEEVNLDVANGFKFIVAEKEPPWHVKLYNLRYPTSQWVSMAETMIREDMEHFARCHKAGIWPGYGCRVVEDHESPTGYRVYEEPVRDLVFPGYANFQPLY